MSSWAETDLFELGIEAFDRFKAELSAHGLEPAPEMRVVRAAGLLCYYSLDDGNLHLSIPEWNPRTIDVFQMIMGSLFDARDADELLRFLELFIPRLVGHELGHHLRHQAGLFDERNLWAEEQIANELALALTKRRWAPEDREFAARFIRRALASLADKVEGSTIANDSYSDLLESLYAEGRLGTQTMLVIRTVGELFSVEPMEVLRAAGVLPEDVRRRLDGREDLIDSFNTTYTNDQLTYMYYQMGWMQVDLTGRETGYIEEFAARHLGHGPRLLPHYPRDHRSTTEQVKACYRAHQLARTRSETAARWFYKRYRTELLERLTMENLGVPLQHEAIRRNGDYLLEAWESGAADRLEMLAPLVPDGLRDLLPSRVESALRSALPIGSTLPTETDRRLFLHVCMDREDPESAETLRRLELLERSELFAALPAELLMEVAHCMFEMRLEPGEPIIWQGDRMADVYVPLEGRLRYETRDPAGRLLASGEIQSGQLIGEMAFLTDEPRSATVRALVPSRLFALKATDLSHIVRRHPTIIKRLATLIVRRLVPSRAAPEQLGDRATTEFELPAIADELG